MRKKRGIETLFISILLVGTIFGNIVYGNNNFEIKKGGAEASSYKKDITYDGDGKAGLVQLTSNLGWEHTYYDLSCTNYYPFASTAQISNDPFVEMWSKTADVSSEYRHHCILTGDTYGSDDLELIYLENNGVLHTYTGNGTELWNYSLPIDSGGYTPCYLSLIDNITSDEKKEIFLGGRDNANTPTIWIFHGNGTLAKTITRSGGYDSCVYARDVIDFSDDGHKDILVNFDAGYSAQPRGAGLINYSSGNEIWHYEIGPRTAAGWPYPVEDIDSDGLKEMVISNFSPHNGHSGSGQGANTTTYDGQKYTIVINENGYEEFTVQGFLGDTDGHLYHSIADLDKDNTKEIITFDERAGSYAGNNYIYLRDPYNGSIIFTYTGPYNERWKNWAISDLNDDGKDEIVVSNSNGTVTILDSNLHLLGMKHGFMDKWLDINVNDINGDGDIEIILSDGSVVRLLNNSLEELWNYTLGGTICDIIVSDVTGDGLNEIIVAADKIYVLGIQSSIVYVDDDYDSSTAGWGYDHFSIIQDGVDVVADGGTVYVYNGIYYENVVVNKTINIFGEVMDNVVVDGDENDTMVINASDVHLSNFTLRDSWCHGIKIEGTHNIIDKCHICDIEGSCWGLPCGIWLLSPDNTIFDCIISDNNCSGIIISSYNNSISSCNIFNNTDGIYLGSSSNNTIIGNAIKENSEDGIFLGTSNSNNIRGNIIYSNIQLGIDLYYSNSNIVSGNEIINNNYGLGLGYSGNNTIICNIVANNNYGAGISYSNDNIFYHNNFNNSYNAYDFGSNTWDDDYLSGGNYWSNYTGIDTNGDGIGETPYNISGGDNQDRYPFVDPLIFMGLSQDWNLITVPFTNSWTAETLGQNISDCTVVIMYNSSSQTFLTHVVGTPHDDFPILDGVGYFIYVAMDSVFVIRDVPIASINVIIEEDWNLIGWCHETTTIAESLGQAINGTTVVIMFNSTGQTFLTHVVGTPHDNFNIERGMGLFIYTDEASIWHGEG